MSYNTSSEVNALHIPANVHNQNITFYDRVGNPIVVDMALIEIFELYHVNIGIIYASQLGACFVMLMVLLVMNSHKNYLQPVFVLNLLSLVFGIIRAIFQCAYMVGPWVRFYVSLADDSQDIPKSEYVTSIVGGIFPVLMLASVNGSLVIQAHTVSKMMDRKYAYPLFAASVLIVCLAVGFRFGAFVTNVQAILARHPLGHTAFIIKQSALYTSAIAIWWFSLIFFGKLVFTVITRHRNGWKRYSTLRVLAIMSCCTMTIPSLFAILEQQNFIRYVFPEAGSFTLTLTALLLPLSSVWAKIADQEEISDIRESIRVASEIASARNSHPDTARYGIGSSSSTVMGSDERKGSIVPLNNTATIDIVIGSAASARDSTELDLEAMGIRVDGVRVDRSYSINSC